MRIKYKYPRFIRCNYFYFKMISISCDVSKGIHVLRLIQFHERDVKRHTPLFFHLGPIRALIRNFARNVPASVTICWRIGSMTGTARVLRQIVDAGTGGWMHIGALPGLVSLRVLRRSGMLPHPVATGAHGAE